ncbi:hypothetical protein AB0H36_36835 [Kribbella sp. NPDC050820]|uniref:hypothetical protein n=1 Tax=Kribbella sp. NPDC050820 TaxID=3155408 RepID=UPI0033C5A3BB
MPKLKLGAVVYGLAAIGLGVSAVAVHRGWGTYSGAHGWPVGATVAVDALAALVLAIGALTRRGLIADDGPWILRRGWLVLVGLTGAGALVAFLSNQDISPWPIGPAPFLPHFVRRMQERYYAGVAEAEVELRAGRDGGRAPGS